MQTSTGPEGNYRTQSFEYACVSDAMQAGVLTCSHDTPLGTVARMMATHHIHSVVVTVESEAAGVDQPWGIVSDLDLAGAAAALALDRTAGDMAVTEIVTIEPQEPLQRAAQLMSEHGTAHLVVVDPTLGRPIGVVSTLDLANVVAWGRA